MRQIETRTFKKVVDIKCPKCKGIMLYDDSTRNLMCENKSCKKCSVGLPYTRSGLSESRDVLLWMRLPEGSQLQRERNIRFFREVTLRVRMEQPLANNVPRSCDEDSMPEDEIADYCIENGIEKEDFLDIRRRDKGKTDEALSAIYELPLEKIKEIKKINIRKIRRLNK